jgi:hypothetical protein
MPILAEYFSRFLVCFEQVREDGMSIFDGKGNFLPAESHKWVQNEIIATHVPPLILYKGSNEALVKAFERGFTDGNGFKSVNQRSKSIRNDIDGGGGRPSTMADLARGAVAVIVSVVTGACTNTGRFPVCDLGGEARLKNDGIPVAKHSAGARQVIVDEEVQGAREFLTRPDNIGWGAGAEEKPVVQRWLEKRLGYHRGNDGRFSEAAAFVEEDILRCDKMRPLLEKAVVHFSMQMPVRYDGETDRNFEERVNQGIEYLITGDHEFRLATPQELQADWEEFDLIQGLDDVGEAMDTQNGVPMGRGFHAAAGSDGDVSDDDVPSSLDRETQQNLEDITAELVHKVQHKVQPELTIEQRMMNATVEANVSVWWDLVRATSSRNIGDT